MASTVARQLAPARVARQRTRGARWSKDGVERVDTTLSIPSTIIAEVTGCAKISVIALERSGDTKLHTRCRVCKRPSFRPSATDILHAEHQILDLAASCLIRRANGAGRMPSMPNRRALQGADGCVETAPWRKVSPPNLTSLTTFPATKPPYGIGSMRSVLLLTHKTQGDQPRQVGASWCGV